LVSSIIRANKGLFFGAMLLAFCNLLIKMVQPVVVNRVIYYVGMENKSYAVAIAFLTGVMGVKILTIICRTRGEIIHARLNRRIKSALIYSIYKKALIYSTNLVPEYNVGKLTNLSDSDV